jgi:hypothetical protein
MHTRRASRIVAALDTDRSGGLTPSEFTPYYSTTTWRQSTANASQIAPFLPRPAGSNFTFNAQVYLAYDINKDGALQAYELALYLGSLSFAMYVGKPAAGIDWDLWGADAALFLMAVADTDASGLYIYTYTCVYIYIMYVCMYIYPGSISFAMYVGKPAAGIDWDLWEPCF